MDLEPLIHRYRGPLAGLLASWGAPWSEAHELAQDAFVEAWLARDSFRGDLGDIEAVGRWLRGIARNLFRRWRRRRRALSLDGRDIEKPTRASEPAEAEALRAAIDVLPEKLRAVVYMHYLEETGVREVAGLLGVTIKSVEGRLYRARHRLAVLMHTEVEEGSS